MTSPSRLDLDIPQGKTWSEVLRWGDGTYTFKPFAASPIVQVAPLRITVTAHGMVDSWPMRITKVVGMTQLNDRDYVAKVIDANTIEVQEVIGEGDESRVYPLNAADYSTYVSGGYVEYENPMNLAGMTMSWQGRKSYDAADPAEFSWGTTLTAAGSGIVLDNTAKTITLQSKPADTAGWTFDTLLHEVEVTDSGGGKPPFVAGRLTVKREVVK